MGVYGLLVEYLNAFLWKFLQECIGFTWDLYR